MTPDPLLDALLAAIAGLAGTAASPAAVLLLGAVAALLRRRPALARLGAASAGAALAIPELPGIGSGGPGAALLIGSAAAGLLWGEMLLSVLLPLWRRLRALRPARKPGAAP